ncbi:MAG: sigma-70 family RNA polymerase sigma factor, partial [Planctomycetota bacterium]
MAENQLQTLYRRFADDGDLAALGALFDAAAPGLLRIARRLARSPEAAEDAVQEVFLTIVEQPASYDRSRPLGPWLVGVLAHRVQSGRRRDARTPEVDRLPVRQEPEPVDFLRGAELEESVRAALETLPETERVAVASRLFDHVGGRELAQRLGISAGAARVRLHRGLTRLRALVPAGVAALVAGGGGRARALSTVRGRVLEAA